MSDLDRLYQFLASCPDGGAFPVEACGEAGLPAQGDGPRLLVYATPAVLAVVPVVGDAAAALDHLLRFADGFAAFPPYQRKWRWSSVLQAQLGATIERIAMRAPDLDHGCVFLYLNAGFCAKYFPVPGAALPAPQPTVFRDDCRGPTLSLEQILRVFGNASVQGTTLHATPGHDSYHCYSRHARLLGIGRGNTDRQMIRGAIFEYCERWVGQTDPREAVVATYAELGERALRPDQVVGLPEAASRALFPGFAPDRPLSWMNCRLENAGQTRLLPVQMVNYLLEPGQLFSVHQNSNGCALGNSPEEAALFGALELIERDALLLTWYSKSTPPRFMLDSFACSHLTELLQLLAAAGYDVRCFDITTEFRVPTVLVLLLGRSSDKLAAFVTAACHPDPRIALHSALAEAHSLLGSAERNFARHRQRQAQQGGDLAHLRDHNQALFYGQAEQLHHFDFLRAAPETLDYADFVAAHPFVARGAAAAFRALCQVARGQGYEVIVADNTPDLLKPLGLSSARVFVPLTIAVTFGDLPVCIPEQRLARAASACNWVNQAADLSHLELHPLG